MFLVPLVVRFRAFRDWRNPERRRLAREQMDFVIGELRPEADLDAVAKRFVERNAWRGELRWHPAPLATQEVRGIEHLRDRDPERGCVLIFMHHGQYDGLAASVARAGGGMEVHGIVHPRMMREDAPTWMKQHFKVLAGGGTMHSTDIGSDGITQLVLEKKIVGLALDVPGRSATRFLGRDVIGSSGAIHLARGTNSPLVVATSSPGPTWSSMPVVTIHPPLEPADYETADDLRAAALKIQEDAFLAWPEGADWPRTRWTRLDEGGQPLPEEKPSF